MLAKKRHEIILDELSRKGGVRIIELVETLGVSEMTVRRDIEILDQHGLLRRVHGGAVEIETPGKLAGIDVRPDVKAKLFAKKVASLVKPDMSVLIVNGSYASAVASAILDLSFVNTLRISTTTVVATKPLCEYVQLKQINKEQHPEVHIVGGVPVENIFSGPFSTGVLRRENYDLGIFQPTGFSSRGMSTGNLSRMDVYREASQACRKNVVLVESPVWGVDKQHMCTSLKEVDTVIFEVEPDIPTIRAMTDFDIEILKIQ